MESTIPNCGLGTVEGYLSHSFAEPHAYWHPSAAVQYYRELIKKRILSDRILSMKERHRNSQYNEKTFFQLWGQWPRQMRVLKGPRCLARPIIATAIIEEDSDEWEPLSDDSI